jgi:ribonuclease HI
MERIIMHTDGGARGNPGPAGIGVVVKRQNGELVYEVSRYIGEATNNVAEYEALIAGLEEAKKKFGDALREMAIDVRMDSELVIRQLTGIYKVKDPGMKERFARVAKIRMEDAPNMTFTHVFREQNAHADELVNRAIDAAGK